MEPIRDFCRRLTKLPLAIVLVTAATFWSDVSLAQNRAANDNDRQQQQQRAANENYRKQQQEQAARQRREQEQAQARQEQLQRQQQADRANSQAAQAQAQARQQQNATQLKNAQQAQQNSQAQQATRTQQQQQQLREQKRRDFQQSQVEQRQRLQGQKATAAAANAQAAATQARQRQIKEATRQPTPGEIQKGFTGRVANGRALIRYKGRIVAVPASRVSGLSARLAAQNARNSASSSPSQSKEMHQRLAALTRQAIIPSNNNIAPCGAVGNSSCGGAANTSQQRQNFSIGQPSNVTVSPRIWQRIGSVQAEKAALSTLDKKWIAEDGKIKWPPNGGFREDRVARDALPPGTKIDRYGSEGGSEGGSYFAPVDVPFEQRALPEAYRKAPLVTYEVVKELPVSVGTASPWFDQPGGGKQYKITKLGAIELEKRGYLKRID